MPIIADSQPIFLMLSNFCLKTVIFFLKSNTVYTQMGIIKNFNYNFKLKKKKKKIF